jgi:hypothetical protein
VFNKHLEEIGEAHHKGNMEKFLEWFNSRDDVTEFRKSVGGWKSDRSGDKIKKNG